MTLLLVIALTRDKLGQATIPIAELLPRQVPDNFSTATVEKSVEKTLSAVTSS